MTGDYYKSVYKRFSKLVVSTKTSVIPAEFMFLHLMKSAAFTAYLKGVHCNHFKYLHIEVQILLPLLPLIL